MRRLLCVLTCLAMLAPAAPAHAQSAPFGPLPEAAPTPAPTAENDGGTVFGQDVGRETLFAIGAGFLVFFVAIGWWISRDARRSLPRGPASEAALQRRADPRERHRRQREKERARKKTRAQRAARKAHRKR